MCFAHFFCIKPKGKKKGPKGKLVVERNVYDEYDYYEEEDIGDEYEDFL